MVNVADPVSQGFVASLARPGANITGLSLLAPELVGKQLELLKEVLPKLSRVAILWNPANPANAALVQHAQVAARALAMRLQPLETRDAREIDNAFAAITTERAGAVIVLAETVTLNHRKQIVDHAIRRRLPTVSQFGEFAEAGSLLTYGPSLLDQHRRAATYVDKLLKGAKAADLPVAQPTTFELVINLKTAKALGLTIPQAVLLRGDRVIQ
jgi:putative ABC transport system substrate-binding protein